MAVFMPDNKQLDSFVENTERLTERLSPLAAKADLSVLETFIENFKIKSFDYPEKPLKYGHFRRARA